MCTCITLNNPDLYFGRNLDLNYLFNETVTITPRNYLFKLKNGQDYHNKYALIGMATVVKEYPLYADAMNERGLAMAGLNYPHHKMYPGVKEGAYNLSAFELIPFVLGQATTVKEAVKILENIWLNDLSFAPNVPVSLLHFMISDKDESVVVEHSDEGLKIYHNPYGVMTNNPSFPYHLENIKNYMHLSPENSENRLSKKLDLEVNCEGMGAIGLPGDFSSPSRFVKAVFLKANSVSKDDEMANVTQFFHILDNISMVKGAVITADGSLDITTYNSCISAKTLTYYYKTYDNYQISAISLLNEDLDGDLLIKYPLVKEARINYQN